ncbi:MAG: J domain-containing protein [Verrucomicrobiota bacterium]
MDDIRECYRILDLEPGASLEEIKRAYRELVKVWHPDRFRSDPKLQAKAGEKLKQINLAYERLCKEAAAEGSHKAAATKTKAATNPAPERTRPEDEATHVPPVKDPSSTNEPENVHLTRWIWMAAAVVALLIIAVTRSEKPQESGNSARVQLPTPPEQVAAEQGDAVAQRILGDMYAEGSGVVQDEAKAVEWFRKAATQGDSDAQRRLGQMYAEGRGVPKDEAKAEEWFQKSEPSEPSEKPMEKIFSKMPRVNSPTIDVIQTTSTANTFKVAPQQVSVKVNAKTFLEAKTEASQQSQRLATAKYPDLKNKASSFHAKFTELYGAAKSDGKGLLDDPNWPMVVADETMRVLAANWRVSSKIDPIDDSRTTVFSVEGVAPSDDNEPPLKPRLVIRFAREKNDVYIVIPEREQKSYEIGGIRFPLVTAPVLPIFSGSKKVEAKVRWGKSPPIIETWEPSTDFQAIFAPAPQEIIGDLLERSQLLIQATPERGKAILVNFSVVGFKEALAPYPDLKKAFPLR